jgi:lysophospholipase L1-like esterase
VREWIIRLTLVVFGFFIAIVALEFGLSKFASNPKTFHTDFFEPDKYIGWKGKPGKEGSFMSYKVVQYVKINSYGFRDKEHNYKKEKDVFRILVLGDSFAEGLQVPLEQTFPYILEKRLNSAINKRFEVINLGVSGFSTAQEYLTLKYYGLRYQPDLVILAFYVGKDVEYNSLTLHPSADTPFFTLNDNKLEEIPFKIKVSKPDKDEEQTKLAVMAKFFPNVYYLLSSVIKETPLQILENILVKLFPNTYNSLSNRIREKPWLGNFLWRVSIKKSKPESVDQNKKSEIPDYFQVYAQEYPPEWQDAWKVTNGLILKLAKELEMDKIGFLVVIIPNEFEFRPEMRDGILKNPQLRTLIDLKKPERILSNFLEANNIDYLLLRPEFEEYTKETRKRLQFPYEYENHWNADGHALTAQLIYKKLKDDELVPIKGRYFSSSH